jgi:hypothetical protein
MAPMHAVPLPMQPYEFQLTDHVLRVSLPPEIVRGEWPIRHTRRFDPQNASFVQDDFYEVFEVLCDFNGPFWVGAYGSLKINIIVQKRKSALAGDITTIEGSAARCPAGTERFPAAPTERIHMPASAWRTRCATRHNTRE